MSMRYRQEPLPKTLPTLPIPGDTNTTSSPGRSSPSSMSSTYVSVCKFWTVAFELNYRYYYEKAVALANAEIIFQKLLHWADQMDHTVSRNDKNLDHVLNLQSVIPFTVI
jgi:hypothetical protein